LANYAPDVIGRICIIVAIRHPDDRYTARLSAPCRQ
jgi:hypothetical protein